MVAQLPARASANVRLGETPAYLRRRDPKNDPALATRLAANCSRFPRLGRLQGLRPEEEWRFDSESMVRAARDVVVVVFELRAWHPLESPCLKPALLVSANTERPRQSTSGAASTRTQEAANIRTTFVAQCRVILHSLVSGAA